MSPTAATLDQEIRQRKPFVSLEEEVFLGLQRTASLLLQALGRELKGHDLTPAQYNALRILRGAEPDAAASGGLTCSEIGERLVSPGPDVTRLLDRLEQRGLVLRQRDAGDRRVVRARITAAGLALLAEPRRAGGGDPRPPARRARRSAPAQLRQALLGAARERA